MTSTSTSRGTRRSLLARAGDRDSTAWRELVELYAPLVAFWSRQWGLDEHDSADCIQDVFASVAVSISSFEPRGATGAFRRWLWTITHNKFRDLARRKSRQVDATGGSTARQALLNVPDPMALSDAEPTGVKQLKELMRRGLEQVQGEFESQTWHAFWRTVVDGIQTVVVAQELGVTPASVRQSRSRVLRRLRQQFGDMS